MEEQLKLILRKAKKPISFDKICEKMEAYTKEEQEKVKMLLADKVDDYAVIQTPSNNYVLISKTSFKKGRFYGNRGGDGKVIVTTSYTDKDGNHHVKEDKYPVDKGNVSGAIDGDLVLINTYAKDKKGNMAGSVEKIIDRNLNNIMGEVYRVGDSYFVRPIDKKKQNLTIALEGEAIEGQRVSVALGNHASDNFYTATVDRVFDHKDDPDEDILWEAFKCGIDDKFSDESLEQVKYIPNSVSDADKIGRMDLTDWEIFTIDGKDTKDIDDALSCKKLDNGNYLIGVHIADVSHYVPEGSALDKDALKRGTSAYLAGKVIPMLPHELSNGICSLNPHVERLAMSCMMEVDNKGNVVRHDIWKSVIKSNLKMNYDSVNQILKDGVVEPEYEEHAATLRNLNKVALILRKNRMINKAIDFNKPELKVEIGEDGKTSGFSVRVQDVGEHLIEEFMLLANETVDKHLSDLGAPCLHRVHDIPNEERLEDFIRLLNAVGYTFDKGAAECCENKKYIQELADVIKDTGKLSNMLSTNMVRCMSKAKYSPINIGHYGLSKDNYCHFTSPIRRYPDLTIHRLLNDCVMDEEHAEKNMKKWESKLPEIALQSSKMERVADDAETQTLNMRCAEYMSKRVGQDFDGTIIGLSDNGMQIQLDNFIEGRVRPKNLPGDYSYNPETFTLISLDGKDDYYIGDRLSLKVKDANKETKTIDFKINEKIDENRIINSNDQNQYVKALKREERANRDYYKIK